MCHPNFPATRRHQRSYLYDLLHQITFTQCWAVTNKLSDYASTLFEKSIGFSKDMSALMSGFLQTWFFLASFIPWVLIDRIGRKPLVGHLGLDKCVVADMYLADFHDKRHGSSHGRSGCLDIPS